MSRTLSTDGCYELSLLHLSDPNRVRHALIELRDRFLHGLNVSVSAGQQILMSSDLTSRCLGFIVSLVEAVDVIRLLVVFSNLFRLKQRHHLIDH